MVIMMVMLRELEAEERKKKYCNRAIRVLNGF